MDGSCRFMTKGEGEWEMGGKFDDGIANILR